ncbi:MAG: hypothetical protein PHC71_03185 [Candidatus Omnitrophica bacterium]|nr:hypothetical protein [Candidatus Omnitrophota bacterium]
MMSNRELILNIAVNLGRLGRWACEGRLGRLNQFMEETEGYINQLEKTAKSPRFQKTFDIFKENFDRARSSRQVDSIWAETMFTWANILTHRASLV